MRYLLDTNTVIYFFKKQGRVSDRLIEKSPSQVAISVHVWHELCYGVEKSQQKKLNKERLAVFRQNIRIIEFELEQARRAAKIRAEVEKKGRSIGTIDLFIAAAALVNSMILVTHNTKEFKVVPGLQLEDWY